VAQRSLFEEITMTRKCRHIVDVFRMDVLDDYHTKYFFVDMELCIIDLATLLEAPNDGFSGERNVWKIMSDIGSAIQYVHDQGLVVVDMTPRRGSDRLEGR
jgi:serine/threonine protein kinase